MGIMKWRIVIIVLVAVLVLAYMRTGLLDDCVGIAGFVWFALIPILDRNRVRAPWATFSIFFSGLLGAAMGTLHLLLHSSLIVVSHETNHLIDHCGSVVWGLLLGVTCMLVVSGQLPGPTREVQDIRPDPAD